jgi:hypothetical protein
MTTAEAVAKITKLLALAEGGDEHEAAAAAARVQVLLAKFRLTLDDLKARELTEVRVPVHGGWADVLLMEVARACGCKLLFVERVTPALGVLIGAALDVQTAVQTFHTVRRVIADRVEEAWAAHVAALTDPVLGLHPALKEPEAKAEYTDSFALGAIQVVHDNLAGKGPRAVKPDLPGGALVLAASRDEALSRAETYLQQKYGVRVKATKAAEMTLSLHAMRDGSKVKL